MGSDDGGDPRRAAGRTAALRRRAVLPGVNHVLKVPAVDDRASTMVSYADSSLPIAPSVVEAVASFVKR